MNEDVQDLVSKAMWRAWQLGQTYWQQADSESYAQNKRSDETQKKFDALVDEVRAAIAKTPNDLGNRRDAGPIGGASVLTDGLARTQGE